MKNKYNKKYIPTSIALTMTTTLRIEKRGGSKYYLTKEIRIGTYGTKVSKLIKTGTEPTDEEIRQAITAHRPELVAKAADKYGELQARKYRSQYLSKELIRTIEKSHYLYQEQQTTLTAHETEIYEQNCEYQYVHGTTAIEGNTCSLKETVRLLKDEIFPDMKQLREINEIQNFRLVKKYRDAYKKPITLDFIKKIHQLIMTNIDLEMAGRFRRSNAIGIVGYDGLLPPADLIEENLQEIIDAYYQKTEEGYYPFEQAVLFHHRFEQIHPFNDGNGRTGREVFNYLLIREKFPRMFFLAPDFRKNYLRALDFGDNEEYAEMIRGFAVMILEQHTAELAKLGVPGYSTAGQTE